MRGDGVADLAGFLMSVLRPLIGNIVSAVEVSLRPCPPHDARTPSPHPTPYPLPQSSLALSFACHDRHLVVNHGYC